MPISPSNPPKAAVATVYQAMKARATRSTFATSRLRRADISTLEHSTPHRVDILPLEKILLGGDLRQMTKPSGWRFLIHQGSKEAIAAARVVERERGQFQFGEITEGALVTETEKTIRHAESLPQVRDGHFEIVLLLVPEIYVAALWLQGPDRNSDLMLPICSSPASGTNLAHSSPVSPAAFLAMLQGIAQTVCARRK